jgi:choline monooxygenase
MAPFVRPERSVDRFDPDPAKSFTLPADLYTRPEVLEQEWSAIFHKTWQLVGPASTLAEPGSYLTAEIGDQRVFVLRSADGELRAFFNVCLHRGHSLLSGQGSLGARITCPYHAWAYDTDGRLSGARMSDRMEGFDLDDYALPGVAVEEFCGFVFVNLDPDPLSMNDTYPGAEETIRSLVPQVDGLVPASVSTFEIQGNWKNVGDNLLECYHCHPAHRAFVDLIDMDTYRNETYQNWSVKSGQCRADNAVYAATTGSPGFASVYLWPNLSIGCLPGQRGALAFSFLPTSPESTHQELLFLTPDGQLDDVEKQGFQYFNDVLGPEDVSLVEDVQVGLRSLGYHQGKFICIPDRPEISEHSVHHFHAMVRAALGIDD